jgi:hypothetical protein
MRLRSVSQKDDTSSPDMSPNIAKSYNRFKTFNGKQYTGMKVGMSHKWYYDKGEWKEKKVTPDKWEFSYAVTKRRAGHAPEGSGVPVGTEYHWYILADQVVKKLDANNYSTSMTGLKYKLAHRRQEKEDWSARDNAQREKLIEILKEMISQLENDTILEIGDEPIPPLLTYKKPKKK